MFSRQATTSCSRKPESIRNELPEQKKGCTGQIENGEKQRPETAKELYNYIVIKGAAFFKSPVHFFVFSRKSPAFFPGCAQIGKPLRPSGISDSMQMRVGCEQVTVKHTVMSPGHPLAAHELKLPAATGRTLNRR